MKSRSWRETPVNFVGIIPVLGSNASARGFPAKRLAAVGLGTIFFAKSALLIGFIFGSPVSINNVNHSCSEFKVYGCDLAFLL